MFNGLGCHALLYSVKHAAVSVSPSLISFIALLSVVLCIRACVTQVRMEHGFLSGGLSVCLYVLRKQIFSFLLQSN